MVLTKANKQPSRWILCPDPPILSFLPSAGDFFLRILNTLNVKKCLDFSSERTLGKVSLIVLDLQLYLKPRIKLHPPVNLITIKKRWDRLYDLAGNWRAGIYLCACFSVRTSQAVYVSVSYVCVCDGRPHAAFMPDLAAPSPRLSQWGQMARTYPTKKPSNAHSQTWCTTQELPWHPLTNHSIQQWVMHCILSHCLSLHMYACVCVNFASNVLLKSPEVSRSNHTCCSFLTVSLFLLPAPVQTAASNIYPTLTSPEDICSIKIFSHVYQTIKLTLLIKGTDSYSTLE